MCSKNTVKLFILQYALLSHKHCQVTTVFMLEFIVDLPPIIELIRLADFKVCSIFVLKTLQQPLLSAVKIPKIFREKRGRRATEKNAIASIPAVAGFCSLIGEVLCNAVDEEEILTKHRLVFQAKLVPHTIPL